MQVWLPVPLREVTTVDILIVTGMVLIAIKPYYNILELALSPVECGNNLGDLFSYTSRTVTKYCYITNEKL